MKKILLLCCIFVMNSYAQKASFSSASKSQKLKEQTVDETNVGVDLMHGNDQGFTILPNADNNAILISVGGKIGETRHVTMVDLSGRTVIQMTNRRENTFLLDVSTLRNGIYSIEVISGRNICRKKWAKR